MQSIVSSDSVTWSAVVIGVAAAAVASLYFFARASPKPEPEPETEEPLPKKAVWTLEEISKYNGQSEKRPILMGIEGKVFDVTKGRDYYGKDGGYRVLAGRDATRLLAKNSLAPEKDDESVPLTEAEKQQLVQWQEFFNGKYPVVGSFEPQIKY
jgi:membrane-associated progesterone receptor component